MINWQQIATVPKRKKVLLWYPEQTVAISGYFKDKPSPDILKSHGCGCCAGDDELPTHWAELGENGPNA